MHRGPGFWTEEARPIPRVADLARLVGATPWSALLASGGKVSRRSRFTFAAFDPFLVVTGRPDGVDLSWRAGRGEDGAGATLPELAIPEFALPETLARVLSDSRSLGSPDPMPLLRALLDAYPVPPSPSHPPFTGGLAGWWGYDLGRAFERLPERVADPLGLPTFALGMYDLVVAIDHLTRKATLVATGYPEIEPERREARARARLAWISARLASVASGSAPGASEAARTRGDAASRRSDAARPSPAFDPARPLPPEIRSNVTRDGYLEAVRRVKNYIRAGDIFQANVTQRLRWPAPDDPAAWFVDLLDRNPVAFASFLHCGEIAREAQLPLFAASDATAYHVVSLSPERFLRVSGDHIETAPIKGTRPRGADRAADEREARELLASPKDRAELVMIVDLLRNDLGRVAVSGSVAVPELYSLESYATVHHLVARITARLRPGLGPLEALRAAFPGGSISGAPKIRAMEILDEVEPHSRGLFMGAIGYVGANGEMDTSIAIRTAVVKEGMAHLQVGGGVVHDSRAEDEYQESLYKAAAILGDPQGAVR